MIFDEPLPQPSPLRAAISAAYLADEARWDEAILRHAAMPPETVQRVENLARDLVTRVRERGLKAGGIDAFLTEYDLSSQEGVVLMCLAEALLRIPDDETADQLIRDKLSKGKWDTHLGHSHSLFVNASTWGLMLTGRMVRPSPDAVKDPASWLSRLIGRSGEPVARMAMRQAMRILGHQFVMGETIEGAIKRSRSDECRRYRYSFDMLGEAALTAADAERYFAAYSDAIAKLRASRDPKQDLFGAAGISVKLSALHPRYELAQRQRVLTELTPRLAALAQAAREANIALTVDAEESDRLELSLDVFEEVFTDPALQRWEGFGLAVQAYQKRALPVVDWVVDLARREGRRIPVRLVKGAYWDTEIKRTQEQGLGGYPVFTRKAATDVSYLACAKRLLQAPDAVYGQFATHNAHTIASIYHLAGGGVSYEFQRLHGMGETLYEEVVGGHRLGVPCRVYAPVGGHKDLLPYLVRRLLENGANTSFVNRIVDDEISVDQIVADPIIALRDAEPKPHPHIPLPRFLYGGERLNSQGINLHDVATLRPLAQSMDRFASHQWCAAPIVGGEVCGGDSSPVFNPANRDDCIGNVTNADDTLVDQALTLAANAYWQWDRTPAEDRAGCLERMADLLEQHMPELMAMCTREGGKTLADGVAEVREAADFCRYYAMLARKTFAQPMPLQGATGERNQLELHGRGVFACISPWNFPLAIFTGQVAAALAAGNAVIAKPAKQTPMIAMRAVELFHQAGVPAQVLHFLPGSGSVLGPKLACDPRVAGIAFTGSTETAQSINQLLAARRGAIVPFIAETGGQNAMIVDSSALPDQVISDVLRSAYTSAGQRCSALRVLFVQQDVADRIVELLAGAMEQLRVGNPAWLHTDVGPVIDEAARKGLAAHAERMASTGRLLAEAPLSAEAARGTFFAPHAFELTDLNMLQREVFGPVLHVVRFPTRGLDRVIQAVNQTGYGLTLGIHSRIDATAEYIQQRVRVGNTYVNRNIIGSVVGVQPFGGEGLSGTGPKAGGPHYLFRFATERTVTINTAAMGGNTTLLSLRD